MKIGIVGLGVVGSAVKFGFEKLGHTVIGHDRKLGTKLEELLDAEIIYLCLPTPQDSSGKCDTSIIEDVIQQIVNIPRNAASCHDIAIKSTVYPGFTNMIRDRYKGSYIRFGHVPEFLRERCSLSDFIENQRLLVIGNTDEQFVRLVKKSHGRYPKEVRVMDPLSAEFCKYFHNLYSALRVGFANEFFDIVTSMGADFNLIKEAATISLDIKDVYLDVNDKMRGFSGPCLPKDLSAICHLIDNLGLDCQLLKTLQAENNKREKTVMPGMRHI